MMTKEKKKEVAGYIMEALKAGKKKKEAVKEGKTRAGVYPVSKKKK